MVSHLCPDTAGESQEGKSMNFRKNGNHHRGDPEINLIPFIDVLRPMRKLLNNSQMRFRSVLIAKGAIKLTKCRLVSKMLMSWLMN